MRYHAPAAAGAVARSEYPLCITIHKPNHLPPSSRRFIVAQGSVQLLILFSSLLYCTVHVTYDDDEGDDDNDEDDDDNDAPAELRSIVY